MTRPWRLIDTLQSREGLFELRERGAGDFHLCLDGRILMNSRASRSEEILGRWAAESVADASAPSVLIGGLGMGLTLRAALQALPEDATVRVAEIEPRVVEWCRGPLRDLCGDALADPRVELEERDVAGVIRDARGRFHAIALDLYEGVRVLPGDPEDDPFYGRTALERARRALAPGGVFARWCEQQDGAFERRLARAGFAVEVRRAGRGGRRHTVYRARRS